jgi:hypothetical protein
MYAPRLYFWIGTFLCSLTAFSQKLNYIHYNTNNSRLPHDIVYHVRQTDDGYLWISTDDGLIRYDGTEMVEFNKGLRSRYVIATDGENGANWISTWKGGIHVLKNGRLETLTSDHEYGSFATSTNDILVYDDLVIGSNFADYMAFRRYPKHPDKLVPWSLALQQNNRYWVTPEDPEYYHFIKTSDHRLIAYGKTGVFTVGSGKLKRMATPFIPDDISESRSGKLYVRLADRLYLTDPSLTRLWLIYTIPKTLLKAGYPRFDVLPSGNICLGFSERMGSSPYVFYLVSKHSGTICNLIEETGSKARASDLLIDNEGGIWLATDGDGVYHIFDWKYKLFGSDLFFGNAAITCLFPDGPNRMYIGTKKGIYFYHRDRLQLLPETKGSYVHLMFHAAHHRMGAAIDTKQQVRRLTFVNGKPQELDCERRFEFPHYTIWTEPNNPPLPFVRSFINGERKTEQIRLNCFLSTAAEGPQQELWMIAAPELYVYHPAKGVRQIRFPELRNRILNCLYYQAGIGMWIGTDNGLLLVGEDGKHSWWGEKQGLTNLNIKCLFSDKPQSLWIGTQNGLFHLQNGGLSVFKKRDGLIADDVNSLAMLNQKELAVGSSKGFTILPFGAHQKQGKAQLSIEKIIINGKHRSPGRVFELPHSSRIYLVYRSTTFIYPELLRFRYRLNKQEAWIPTVNKSLFLSNLKPGDYQLELSVKQYNSPFSKPVVLRFTILPPWWRSTPFVLVSIGCCLLLILLIFRLQFRRQQRILRSRQEFSELKMKALQAQLNPHFISNALSVIQYYVLTRNELAVNRYLGQFSDLTRLFLEVSRQGLVTLSMELELLQHYLQLEQMRFGDKVRFSIAVAAGIDPGQTYIPGLLVQPFVENSIHHGLVYLPADKPGIVSVNISRQEDMICVVIDDNGIGRTRSREIKAQATKAFQSRSGTILKELQDTYNSQPGCCILITTTDKLTDTGASAGTTVTILIRIHKRMIPHSTTHTL